MDAVFFPTKRGWEPEGLILIFMYFVLLTDCPCDHDVFVLYFGWLSFQGARGVLSIHCEVPDNAAFVGIDYCLNMLDAIMTLAPYVKKKCN